MNLIVGCGFLGTYLAKQLSEKTGEPTIATVRDLSNAAKIPGVQWVECDVTRPDHLKNLKRICQNTPLTVFYFAAFSNIDRLFLNKEEGAAVNIHALRAFFSQGFQIDRLFFSSSDCVYGETTDRLPLFTECSPLLPINEYGRQKRLAEQIVLDQGFCSLRFSYLIGPSLTKKKHFYDSFCETLRGGGSIEMIDGMIRNVLSYETAAKLLAALSERAESKQLPAVINVCADKPVSKYELGLEIAAQNGFSKEQIIKISQAEGAKFFKDRRAFCIKMDNALLKSLLPENLLVSGRIE